MTTALRLQSQRRSSSVKRVWSVYNTATWLRTAGRGAKAAQLRRALCGGTRTLHTVSSAPPSSSTHHHRRAVCKQRDCARCLVAPGPCDGAEPSAAALAPSTTVGGGSAATSPLPASSCVPGPARAHSRVQMQDEEGGRAAALQPITWVWVCESCVQDRKACSAVSLPAEHPL